MLPSTRRPTAAPTASGHPETLRPAPEKAHGRVRGLSRQAVTMPARVKASGEAVSARLSADIGYVRILGGMNEKTREAFFEAFDALDGVKGIVLDCRGFEPRTAHRVWM